MMEVFVEQALALPGSAKYTMSQKVTEKIPHTGYTESLDRFG